MEDILPIPATAPVTGTSAGKGRGSPLPPATVTEEEIRVFVRRAQDGDSEAFGRLYDHFFTQVYRYAAFRLPAELAEDTVADIFVKAWEKLYQYKMHKNVPFAAWLFRIARHSVIDVYRTQRGFEEVPETIEDPDTLNRADSAVRRRDLLQAVRDAVGKLPRRYREILLLSFVGELGHSEVARVLHLTEGAVRVLKLRALRKLEGYLPPEFRDSL